MHTWEAQSRYKSFTSLVRGTECTSRSPVAHSQPSPPRFLHPRVSVECRIFGPTSKLVRSREREVHSSCTFLLQLHAPWCGLSTLLMELVGLGDERTPSGKHSSLEGITVRLTKLFICIGTTSHRPSM